MVREGKALAIPSEQCGIILLETGIGPGGVGFVILFH